MKLLRSIQARRISWLVVLSLTFVAAEELQWQSALKGYADRTQ
jgi:hypothetical protein